MKDLPKFFFLATVAAVAYVGYVFAADDDPDPMTVTTTATLTTITPAGFTVTVEVTPVVKVNGTNTANVASIFVEKWQETRVTRDGVQVGNVRRESLGRRDATAWFLGRTNVNGIVALNLNPDRLIWAAAGFNNGQ